MVIIHRPSFNYAKRDTDTHGIKWMPTVSDRPHLDSHDWIIDFDVSSWPYYKGTPHWSPRVDAAFRKELTSVIETASSILEIGMVRDGPLSSTNTLFDLRPAGCVYVGVDMSPPFETDAQNDIYVIKSNSMDQAYIREEIDKIGISGFDIICIDGDHSITVCFNDWRYVDMLNENGLVCMHDVNHHPGPHLLMQAIDTEMFEVTWAAQETRSWEWGIGFARRIV